MRENWENGGILYVHQNLKEGIENVFACLFVFSGLACAVYGYQHTQQLLTAETGTPGNSIAVSQV